MKEELINWLMAQCMRFAQNGCCDTKFEYDGTTFGDYVGVEIYFALSDIVQLADYCVWSIIKDFGYKTYDEFIEKEDEEIISIAWKEFFPQFEKWANREIHEWKCNTFYDYLADYEEDEDGDKNEYTIGYEKWFRETYCSE